MFHFRFNTKWAKLLGRLGPLTPEHSFCEIYLFETLCAILYHFYNLKNVKNTQRRVRYKKFGKELILAYLTILVHILDSQKRFGQKGKQQNRLGLGNLHVHEAMEQRLLFRFSKSPLIK